MARPPTVATPAPTPTPCSSRRRDGPPLISLIALCAPRRHICSEANLVENLRARPRSQPRWPTPRRPSRASRAPPLRAPPLPAIPARPASRSPRWHASPFGNSARKPFRASGIDWPRTAPPRRGPQVWLRAMRSVTPCGKRARWSRKSWLPVAGLDEIPVGQLFRLGDLFRRQAGDGVEPRPLFFRPRSLLGVSRLLGRALLLGRCGGLGRQPGAAPPPLLRVRLRAP